MEILNEADPDAAAALQAREAAAGIARARAGMKAPGADACEDCRAAIPPARRRAAPFAIRCFHCQQALEAEMRRSA